MSAPMKKRPTSNKERLDNKKKNASFLRVVEDGKLYAIPKKIAEKYIVKKKKSSEATIPSEAVFASLEKKLTKAGALLKGVRMREGSAKGLTLIIGIFLNKMLATES